MSPIHGWRIILIWIFRHRCEDVDWIHLAPAVCQRQAVGYHRWQGIAPLSVSQEGLYCIEQQFYKK
jgi:hypothetical protein